MFSPEQRELGRLARSRETGVDDRLERQVRELRAELLGLQPADRRQRHRTRRVAVYAALVVQDGLGVPRKDVQAHAGRLRVKR